MNPNTKLVKYEFTEEGKKLLPSGDDKYGKFLEINGPSGPFKMKARLLCDYHAEALLKREDGKAEQFIKLKSSSKASSGATSPPVSPSKK